MTSLIDKFSNKPVLLQLVEPQLAVISAEEVDLGGELGKCGNASLAFMTPKDPATQAQPAMIQVIRGNIEEHDDDFILIATTGADNKTPVRVLVKRSNVRAINFVVTHVALPEPTPAPNQIVTP